MENEYVEPRRGRHLSYNDRIRIEAFAKQNESQSAIARALGVHPSTISRELKRGATEIRSWKTWEMLPVYSADIAQQKADFEQTAKGRPEKIGKRFDYLSAIEAYILDDYSPAAAIAAVSVKYQGFSICPTTCYKYLRLHYFRDISYKNLPVGARRQRKGTVKRPNTTHPHHRSIESRSKAILDREEFGHWEMDSVIGKSEGKSESCLVLTERKTREEIVIKVPDKIAKATVNAIAYLRAYFGSDFKKLFKTITCDNGSEFADQPGLDALGVPCFWCHPSCPSERGSNENANRLVRRKFHKGESLAKVKSADARRVTCWINNYPRKLFNWQTSNQVFAQECKHLNFEHPDKVQEYFDLPFDSLARIDQNPA